MYLFFTFHLELNLNRSMIHGFKMINIISGLVFALFFALGIIALPSSPDAEEQHAFGRWCDSILPNTNKMNRVITIVLPEEGMPRAKVEYFDGSVGDEQLTDLGNGIFKINGRPSGDKYRIAPNIDFLSSSCKCNFDGRLRGKLG